MAAPKKKSGPGPRTEGILIFRDDRGDVMAAAGKPADLKDRKRLVAHVTPEDALQLRRALNALGDGLGH